MDSIYTMSVVERQQTWYIVTMTARSRITPEFRTDSRPYHLLEEISAGDLFIGFLTSAGSTRLMYKNAHARARERYVNKLALKKLEQCGYVGTKKKGTEIIYFATNDGKRALHNIHEHNTRIIRHQKKWDGLWRVVAYDFPENKRSVRSSLRYILAKAQFLQVQKSVWVFPYDSSLLTQLLKKDAAIRAHTIFMKARSISLETKCKRHFQLQ